MAIEALGSTQVVLQLLSAYQVNGTRLSPEALWTRLANRASAVLYPLGEHDPSQPDPDFFGDLVELQSDGVIQSLPDGRLEVTDLGQFISAARTCPHELLELERALIAEATRLGP